jgi:hypothetical protein
MPLQVTLLNLMVQANTAHITLKILQIALNLTQVLVAESIKIIIHIQEECLHKRTSMF